MAEMYQPLHSLNGEQLDELAHLTAVQLRRLMGGSPRLAFLLGIVLTVLAGVAGYLLHKVQQHKYGREKTIAGLQELDSETLRQLFGGESLPPWVRFPDVSRAEWINTIMAGLWPHIDRAACKWALENLEGLLNSTDFWRPKWLHTKGVKLHGIFLGQVPPTVTGVKVYSPETYQSRDELAMEYDFSWASKMQVKLVMKVSPKKRFPIFGRFLSMLSEAVTIKISVKDVVARGRLRAVLRPLVDEIPVVGAIKVSLVEAPMFNYKVSAYGGSPLWVPGVEAWVNSFIKDEVLRPYIFPEGFLLRLADVAGAEQERPEGLLTVRVVEATNVPRMDLFSPGDPYVRLWVRQKLKLSTTVKSNATHPVWNEEFQLLVHDVGHQSLCLSMWDSDTFSSDDEIGSVEVVLRTLDLTPGAVNDLWLPLPGPKGKDKRELEPTIPFMHHSEEGAAGSREATEGKGGKRHWWSKSSKQKARQASSHRVTVNPVATATGLSSVKLPNILEGVAVAPKGDTTQEGNEWREPAAVGSSGGDTMPSHSIPRSGDSAGPPEALPQGLSPAGPPSPEVEGGAVRESSSAGGYAESLLQDSFGVSPFNRGISGSQGNQRLASKGGRSQEVLSGVGSGTMSSGSSGVFELAQQRARLAMGQAVGQGQQVLRQALELLPSKKTCELHIQASYSPFTQQELRRAVEGQQSGASLGGLSTRDEQMFQVLHGGVLYIHINQAHNLARRRGLNGGLTKSMQCRVRVGRYEKQTERGKRTDSLNPVFDQMVELILDATTVRDSNTMISVEIHDINWLFPSHFKGRVNIPLKQVIEQQRLRDVWQLEGVPSGRIDMELEWLGAMGM